MKKVNWFVVGIIGIILLLFLFGGGMMGGWGYRSGWGMTLAPALRCGTSAGVGGPGMMGWGYSPFGWVGMLFMWLIPVGFVMLTVLGIAWLAQNVSNTTSPATGHNCPNCGKDTQADWKNCPYCGTALK